MVQKNATYKVYNGSDFDEIYFKTVEGMITGAVQGLTGTTGYRIFPPDSQGRKVMIQWGYTYVELSSTFSAGRITLPTAFPNGRIGNPILTISANGYDQAKFVTPILHRNDNGENPTINFDWSINIVNNAGGNTSTYLTWVVFGY